jgi:aryl-alcohol dehydrogenase-like predicted oxidoreductase
MEMRFLGKSGLKVSALSFGTMTFGGGDDFFQHMGGTQLDEAQRLVDICLEAGVNLFDWSLDYDELTSACAEFLIGNDSSRMVGGLS